MRAEFRYEDPLTLSRLSGVSSGLGQLVLLADV